ncbi:MAG: CRISPR-associated protein Cas4 [Acutalibacteraceae bacterium]|nr:CRISPR-associated protein Cas4 [Acutalibacteraceae bacterium]
MSDHITGMQMYYYYVCHKKLWYFSHEISMENENENVKLGKIIDETTYQNRDKHIMIDNTINIDFMAEHNILHEVKKSRNIEEAGIWQVKYYLYYLKKRGVEGFTGKIDYPMLKQSIRVELTDDDEIAIEKAISDIKKIIDSELPPEINRKKFCKSCAYYDLCFI